MYTADLPVERGQCIIYTLYLYLIYTVYLPVETGGRKGGIPFLVALLPPNLCQEKVF